VSQFDNSPGIQRRTRGWYHFTPGRLMVLLIAVQTFLLLSDTFQWFSFGKQKGTPVLMCLAFTALVALMLPLWLLATRFLRIRFQFGLASLMLLVTSIGVACGWFAHELRQAKFQRKIAAVAPKFNCGIFYDYNISPSGGFQFFTGDRPGITWLHRVLGEDFFHDIVGAQLTTDEGLELLEGRTSIRRLILDHSQVTDRGMRPVERFKELEWLDLRDANHITDAGLQPLSRLTRLKGLLLRRTGVGDAGMVHLQDLKQLEILDLGMTKVTHQGLVHLSGLTRLKQLSFWGNRIEDPGMTKIGRMMELEILELGFAPITDAGLVHVKDLRHLQNLNLRGSQVTDAGLTHLAGLQRLQQLDLFNTQITNHGIEQLARLSTLRSLHVGETRVDETGIATLRRALPACKVDH
jgi:hypothetical protein